MVEGMMGAGIARNSARYRSCAFAAAIEFEFIGWFMQQSCHASGAMSRRGKEKDGAILTPFEPVLERGCMPAFHTKKRAPQGSTQAGTPLWREEGVGA